MNGAKMSVCCLSLLQNRWFCGTPVVVMLRPDQAGRASGAGGGLSGAVKKPGFEIALLDFQIDQRLVEELVGYLAKGDGAVHFVHYLSLQLGVEEV